MNISLRQLKAFASIARWNSFTRAAEELHITQAGLSRMLRDLETQLGSRLFERTTRAVSLTEAGRALLPVAERAVNDLEEAAARLGELTAQASRSLTVAATPLVCATILPQVCRDLARAHPEIRLAVKDAERPSIQSMVETGSADLGLGILLPQSSGLERRLLGRLRLVCVSPAREPGGGKDGLRWSALRGLPLIGLPPDNPIQEVIDAQLQAIGRHNEQRPTFNNLQTLLGMVEAGMGSAILPSFVQPACERLAVRLTPLRAPAVSLDYYAILRRGREEPAAAQPFLESLVRWMQRNGAGPLS
ncbi:MAG: LysR family transcriptional regulator [Candidatus Protistobacter heckmanni]|nr:LysR family transcriptional regulator [Candidatus Protistobacter heckmanni]